MSSEKAGVRRHLDCCSSDGKASKRACLDRCFAALELKIETESLVDLDSEKMKNEIKRWAKAVVRYACQLSSSSDKYT
ncbi:hypothetical protein J5N97_019345 [Dioscorea zingiberensis]|uniref:Uncharacterized protein n=1 Tax=Dioscorea zingiberensis TaxID=325984 RepID=A0A9D5HC78_9LILI|nr:hypothetical protein J5N97_019345 [Dioscorea zingiberensis]